LNRRFSSLGAEEQPTMVQRMMISKFRCFIEWKIVESERSIL